VIQPNDIPSEEPTQPSLDEKLANLAQLLQDRSYEWHPRLHEILGEFERFLVERPEPPRAWRDRVGENAHKFDYHQIVLPPEYINPYEDDLSNVRLLEEKFAGEPSFMALEHTLLLSNRFLFTDGHSEPISAPRPVLMLETRDEEHAPSGDEEIWDCALTVFPDGSYWAYNLDRDDAEEMGEELGDLLEKHMELLSRLSVTVPVEGVHFGILVNLWDN